MNQLISIIIPAFNEEKNVSIIAAAIEQVFANTKYTYEIIFVDDGSKDDSANVVKQLSLKNDNIKYIFFSRNFGKDNALSAGLQKAKGDAIVTIDADMQHPPEMILQMIELWQQGNEVVYTYREEKNEHASKINHLGSSLFYKTINKLSDIELEDGTADYRLIDRKVVDVLNALPENDPFYRGLVKWVGFNQKSIPYTPNERNEGVTKYSKRALTRLALKGITSFSTKPLNIAIYLGFTFSLLSLLYIPYAILSLYFGWDALSGWASIIVTIAFFGGLQLMILGIIGLYLGKLFMQNKQRPHFIIKETNIK
ncbi:MAG: glycosyltransferase family 2 protein [Chitinophagaceae bacterium]